MEQDGVFAHEVVDGLGLFAEGDDVFADRVEAEECFFAVDNVELEQWGGVVGVDGRGGFLDQAETAQLVDGVGDRTDVACMIRVARARNSGLSPRSSARHGMASGAVVSGTGNDLAAQAGASLKELMARMGHSSTRAALIYLHATSERDHEIAKEISKRVTRARRPKGKRVGREERGESEGHAGGTPSEEAS